MYFLLSLTQRASGGDEFAGKLFHIFEVHYTLSTVCVQQNISRVPTPSPLYRQVSIMSLSCKGDFRVTENGWKIAALPHKVNMTLIPRPHKGENFLSFVVI